MSDEREFTLGEQVEELTRKYHTASSVVDILDDLLRDKEVRDLLCSTDKGKKVLMRMAEQLRKYDMAEYGYEGGDWFWHSR